MVKKIQHLYRAQGENRLLYAWFSSMHTRVDLILCYPGTEDELLLVAGDIYDTLHRLESIANYYDPSSELARVNRTASVAPVAVSPVLYEMISLCLEYHEKTSGCFDVTVHSCPYTSDTIHLVELSAEERTVFFRQPGVTINLSGFLKGYALDKIREYVSAAVIGDALINIGNSSVLALGNHPHGKGWKVDFVNNAFIGTDNAVLLQNECLTTSGNDSPGRRHIISPQTGNMVEGVGQVAVVTESGTLGEILSTAFFAAAEEQRALLSQSFPVRMWRHFEPRPSELQIPGTSPC